MGDWIITTWWGTGPMPTVPQRLGSDEKWAMRLGRVGHSGLWQLDVLSKWAWRRPRFGVAQHAVAVVPAHGEVLTHGTAPFRPGFNVIGAPEETGAGLLAEAARLLGAAHASMVEVGGRPMLCLASAVAPDRSRMTWSVDDALDEAGAAGPVVTALALAAPARRWYTFPIGLYLDWHGYLHTGELTVDVTEPYRPGGTVEMSLTGVAQPLLGERRGGPYARSIYFEFEPVDVPTIRWPFAAGGSEAGHAAKLPVPRVAEAGHDERPVVEALVDRGGDQA